jgi:hypothetical protein
MKEVTKRMVVTSDLERDLIFQSLLKLKVPVELEVERVHHIGIVEKYEKATVLLALRKPLKIDTDTTVRVHFLFHNNHHYFDSVVVKRDETSVQLTVPDQIFKNMQRRHDRTGVPENISMRFRIVVRSDRKALAASSLRDERLLAQELKKQRPAIDKILSGIKRLVSDFTQNFQVKVFKPEEALTIEEEILRKSRKIFLIQNSLEDSIEEKGFHDERFIDIFDACEHLIREGVSRTTAESRLLDLLQRKRDMKIFSECLIPLLLEGEAVGYLRLANDMDYHRSIKPQSAFRAFRYAGILVEALVRYGYFRLESGDDFDVQVINISAGGVLFSLDKPALKRYLNLNTVLHLSIRLSDRQIEARGSVHRIDEDRSEYGVQFDYVNEADARFIDDVVHGRASLN